MAYAWLDGNNSLKAEYKSEEFAFITDTLKIDSASSKILHFNLSKGDQTPFKLSRASTAGLAYQIVFNKGLKQFDIIDDTSDTPILHKIEDDRVKLFRNMPITDSLALRIQAIDSINQTIDTLIWAKFEESDRRKEDLNITVKSGKSFYQELKMALTFNKPITEIIYDSLYLSYDTASLFRITPDMLHWKDSSQLDQLDIIMNVPDSLPFTIFTLIASDSTFQDIEGVYNEKPIKANFRKISRESLADELTGNIQTDSDHLIVQLFTSKDELVTEIILTEKKSFSFKLIEAGSYRLRIIEDENQNGEWDPANFALRQQAEKAYYFLDPETDEKDITIRGGWSIGPLQINSVPDSEIRN